MQLYGQSIGGAVCLYAASTHPDIVRHIPFLLLISQVRGVIVENTFVSLQSLIPSILPKIPQFLLPILLTERWDATLTMPKIPTSTPMLLLSGKQDVLVPPSHMAELKALRGDGRVRWREFDGEHNTTCLMPDYWEEVGKWLRDEVEGSEVLEKGE